MSFSDQLLNRRGYLVLDGGLATHLESKGHHFGTHLWSAELLASAPEEIYLAHMDYLRAGADAVTSASYQASINGFIGQGYNQTQAEELILESVRLAASAQEDFCRIVPARKPIVAASIGPYGASLADGSEYTGDYRTDEKTIRQFHQHRWQILSRSKADLMLCETIPSQLELKALASLIAKTPDKPCWISLSCGDHRHLCDGTPLVEAVSLFADLPQVEAMGVNCCSPIMVGGVIRALRKTWSGHLLVYPNSGERYDGKTKDWADQPRVDWRNLIDEWWQLGVRIFGGCCRVGPDQIKEIGNQLRLLQRQEWP